MVLGGGYWLSVICYRLLVVGYWLSVIGYLTDAKTSKKKKCQDNVYL